MEFENISFNEIWNLKTFVNILTADDKHSLHNRENFLQLIQMKLSKKPTIFSQIFIVFL